MSLTKLSIPIFQPYFLLVWDFKRHSQFHSYCIIDIERSQAKKGGFLNAEVETNSRSTEIEPDRRVCHDPNRSFVLKPNRTRDLAMSSGVERPRRKDEFVSRP